MNGYALANAFRTLRESWRFTSTEADLYYELVGIANERGWPAGFQYSNQLICATIGISEKSLIAARNRLKQAGLLDFVSGHKRAPTAYTLSQKGLPQVSKKGSKSDSVNGSVNGSESDSPLYKELKQNETELKKKLESEQAASAATRLEFEKQLAQMRALVDELTSQPSSDSAPPVAPPPPLKAERGGKFQKPTKPELVDYLLAQKVPAAAADAMADRFLNYYDSNGWKAGRNAMKDWQATARNWAADKKTPAPTHGTPSTQQPNARYNTTARGGFGGFANGPAGRHSPSQPVAGAQSGNPVGGTNHTPGGAAGGQAH